MSKYTILRVLNQNWLCCRFLLSLNFRPYNLGLRFQFCFSHEEGRAKIKGIKQQNIQFVFMTSAQISMMKKFCFFFYQRDAFNC